MGTIWNGRRRGASHIIYSSSTFKCSKMTQFLPPNLLALFTARPPIPFKPPVDGLKKRKNAQPYSGISDFLSKFEVDPPPPATRGETREEKDIRRKKEKAAAVASGLESKVSTWTP